MKYRKNILLRIQYYTTYININNNNNYCYFYNYYFYKNDAKFFSYLNSKGKGRGRKNDKVKNVQLANINYYSRKEKKQILKNIYEKIILKRIIDNEKIMELYLNDKDVQHILKEENINEHDKKIRRIEEIVNNEENLNKKFNQFYDLFCFDLKNVNVAIGVNKNCNINDNINHNIYNNINDNINHNIYNNIYDNINHNIYNNIYDNINHNINNVRQKNNHLNYPCHKSINNKNVFKLNNELIYNNTCTSYVKKYEYIKINLSLIKKFLVFIEKNLINYDNTSSCFKYYFSFNKFIIYFFNYTFDFIKYFDKNLLLSYISLYIKLNLFYSHQLFIDIEEKIKDDKDNKYKDKINEDKKKHVEETIYDINISNEEILDIIKNNNKNIMHMLNLLLHKEVGYYNIINVLHLYYSYYKKVKINDVIKNMHNLFNIDVYSIIKLKKYNNNNNNDNMLSDRVTNLNEEQINYLYSYYSYMICLYFNYMYLLNNIIKQNNFFLPYFDENIIYLLNCIELLCENIFDNKTIIEEKIKQLIMCINNKDVERYLLKDILYNIRYNDYLDIRKNNIIDNNLKCENFDIENKKKINISYNSMYKNNNNNNNYNSDYDNYYTHIIYSNDDTNKSHYLSHNNIIHNNMFRDKDKYLLILYTNTRNNIKSLFQNMTHFFILENCDVILKFLNIIYTTKYMNIYNINILFYSLCINSHVMKTYQIKNVLFFFSLYKNYFILNNVDLGNTIYNWYNKRLIYFIRKKIEIYFEHHSLENSIRSIFLLSDILSYNKIIKKILMKKLELLNIQNISPALFCQIFFLLKKLKCDARNQIGSQLFLKHYKKFIPSLTYIQILYLIENVEYLINRRKRKIFLLLILYCFKKLKENNTHLLHHDSIFICMNHIFKLINIINKFKLYQYCKRNYFVPIYEYILSFDEVQRGLKKESCQLNFFYNNKYFNHFYENNNYTFVINNNDTILIDYNKNDKNKINIKEQKVDDTNEGDIKKCDDDNNKNKIKEHNNNIVIKDNNISSSINSYENYTNDSNVSFFFGTSINCLYKYNIKLELLTCSQIIDMIFFNINTNINIFIIGELYSDLFYRIIRNIPFRKDEILLIFKSMWMSRVYHENLFNTLLEIINNNKRILENYLYSLDILLCLCSYKRDNMKTEMQDYKELIISLFDICFLNIDHICKNIKRQIHFYYCVLFLEVYYPILYLRIIKGKGNILSDISNQIYSNKMKEKEEILTTFDHKKKKTVEEKKKLYMCLNNEVVNKYDVVRYNFKNTKMERINIIGNMSNAFNNNVEQKDNIINMENIKEKKNKEIKNIYEKNKYDHIYNIYNNFSHDSVIYPVCILKKLKEIFFIYQKKYAYKYDLIPFYELLDKLYIRKIKYNNVPIIYLKNYELNNLFVLNIYFPLIKFAILFVKDRKDDIRNDKKMKKDIIKCIHMKNIEKEHISDNKTNDSSSHNSLYPYNFISNNLYSNDIDILIQRLYLYKYHKIHVMVLSKEHVDLFFKKYTSEKQLKVINESNIVFQNVYKHIIKNNKEDHAKMLASLMKKQLQFIFSLNS
ncbi:conserved Plasmodium protein, unknown function [Plasmodium sp. DRC-Itaito]|uniref:RAP protein n=1 Tax=Plasmodium gaboni TaxID=647221 RepID=A0ABY1UVZ5_9APIC|nr:conserved Plasmodium protein, unknown function [Plasmodium gaboni]SOV25469.1 conserved Plasmodium protein, unknown function [Plasmodium sp. DRC-Itaito]